MTMPLKSRHNRFRRHTVVRALLASTALLGAALLPASLPAFAQDAEPASDRHVISLQQADIKAFIDDVAMVTGKTLLVDQRVQGQVTVASDDELTDGEVWFIFKQVLANQGYTVIQEGANTFRVTLLQGSAGSAPLVRNGDGPSGQLATVVLTLTDTDAAEAGKLIRPVLNPQGIIAANPGSRVVVITDFPRNIEKAREIIRALEAELSTFDTVSLRNLTSIDAEEALSALGGADKSVNAVAVPANNSVILEGPAREVFRLRRLLEQIDATASAPRGAISVVPIRHGDGETIAAAVAALTPNFITEGAAPPTVAFEPGSNSLIISASGEVQAELEGIIRRLDQRRPQVMVEAMIVEISDTAARDLGVQFATAGLDGNEIPFIGTNFSRQPGNLLALTGAVAGNPGVPLGGQTGAAAVNQLFGSTGGSIGGISFNDNSLFSVIVNAVEEDTDSNVLSTPFVTTLDNVPATFLVGQEIPIVTGESFGQAGGLVNPFRNFERQDVGIQLNVTPQITEGDVVRLDIENIVSSIAGAITAATGQFVLNKRELTTTVLAESGEIIVLGGLIEDDEQISVEQVPLLGDIPLVGNLFKSEGKSRARTNLMVFLRPTILRTSDDARPIAANRLGQMRELDLQQSGRDISKVDRMIADQPIPVVRALPLTAPVVDVVPADDLPAVVPTDLDKDAGE